MYEMLSLLLLMSTSLISEAALSRSILAILEKFNETNDQIALEENDECLMNELERFYETAQQVFPQYMDVTASMFSSRLLYEAFFTLGVSRKKFRDYCALYKQSSMKMSNCSETTTKKAILSGFSLAQYICIERIDDYVNDGECIFSTDLSMYYLIYLCVSCFKYESAPNVYANLYSGVGLNNETLSMMAGDCKYVMCLTECLTKSMRQFCSVKAPQLAVDAVRLVYRSVFDSLTIVNDHYHRKHFPEDCSSLSEIALDDLVSSSSTEATTTRFSSTVETTTTSVPATAISTIKSTSEAKYIATTTTSSPTSTATAVSWALTSATTAVVAATTSSSSSTTIRTIPRTSTSSATTLRTVTTASSVIATTATTTTVAPSTITTATATAVSDFIPTVVTGVSSTSGATTTPSTVATTDYSIRPATTSNSIIVPTSSTKLSISSDIPTTASTSQKTSKVTAGSRPSFPTAESKASTVSIQKRRTSASFICFFVHVLYLYNAIPLFVSY